jgi:hypothetical protein
MSIKPSQDVVFRDLSGEAVLLNFTTGMYFGLNEPGTRMWKLLLETGDREKTLARLKDEYDVDESRLRGDLDALIVQLMEKGLLQGENKKSAAGGRAS